MTDKKPLKNPKGGLTAAAIEEIIEHAGVKGMKWGVRKQIKSSNPAKRKIRRADKKWQKKAVKTKNLVKLLKKSKRKSKAALNEINNKPEYKGKNLKKDPALRRKYNDEVSRELTKSLNEVAASRVGRSPSKKNLELKYDLNDAGLTWKVVEGNAGRKG